ncbi:MULTISPECIES: hypothetical protein [unclassified Sphingomonas]|jgi:hypothetical protein|uniref:hypothetical protein n=1 Tax=unclassified Sphingomonas TaxID=196159 RepID=UPI000830981C|nr:MULTISPECIES: hypothetical protein [unclassified Sphingomonas]
MTPSSCAHAALRLIALAAVGLSVGCDRAAPDDVPADNVSANVASPAPPTAPDSREPAGDPGTAATIPTPYLGTWDRDASACAAPFSEMRLVIDSARLRFYESVAEVQRVTPVAAGGGIDVAAVVSGEGMTNETTYRLARGAGDVLTVTVDDVRTPRVRCG